MHTTSQVVKEQLALLSDEAKAKLKAAQDELTSDTFHHVDGDRTMFDLVTAYKILRSYGGRCMVIWSNNKQEEQEIIRFVQTSTKASVLETLDAKRSHPTVY